MGIFTSSHKMQLETALAPDDVLNRFEQNMKPDGMLEVMAASLVSTGKILGHRKGDTVYIKAVGFVRNSLKPTIVVKVEPYGSGSKLSTHFTTWLFERFFLIVWLLAASAGSIAFYTSSTATGSIFPLFMPIGGLLVIGLMRVFAKVDEDVLEKFVRRTVDASPIESGSEPSKPQPDQIDYQQYVQTDQKIQIKEHKWSS